MATFLFSAVALALAIVLLREEDSSERPAAAVLGVSREGAARQPASRRLTLAAGAPGTLIAAGNGDLYRLGASDRPRARLTRDRGLRTPEWSPDATRIAFSKNSHIWSLETSSGQARPLTEGAGIDNAPSWSPDGRMLAFDRRSAGASGPLFDVWVVNTDGSGERNLTAAAGASGGAPDWSPDGRRIVFQRQLAIWTMTADGGGARSLTGAVPGIELAPAWSPDGGRIAYAAFAENGGTSDIYVMSSDGGGRVNLTENSPVRGTAPAWSPDGEQIAFEARDGIWLVNADGTGLRRLAGSSGLAHPSWSPKLR